MKILTRSFLVKKPLSVARIRAHNFTRRKILTKKEELKINKDYTYLKISIKES